MSLGYVRVRQVMAGILARRALFGQHLLQFILGLSAGRFLLGGLAPLAPAFAVATSVAAGQGVWPVLGGILLGICTRGGSDPFVHPLADALAVIGGLLLARRARESSRETYLPAAGAAGGANLLVKSCFFHFLKGNTAVFLGVLCESLLAGLFTIPFIYALAGVRGRAREIKLLLGLILILCGLGDIQVGPTVVREIGARGLLLVTAFGWGAGWGAGTGVLLGLLLGGDLMLLLPRTGLYAGTGFFAGVLNGFGRYGVILGFLLASLFFSFFMGIPNSFQVTSQPVCSPPGRFT